LWSHKILYKLEENTRIKILKAILSIRGLTYTSIYEIELQTNITTVNEAVLTSSTTSLRKREREREIYVWKACSFYVCSSGHERSSAITNAKNCFESQTDEEALR
jgi:transcription initiation factor IIE alpha subunit